jgi:hypothetical protein
MVETTKLNETQIHLLKMFQHIKDENLLIDLKRVLKDFYSKKVDNLSSKIWEEKELNNEKMDEILNTHL